jgi:hypothetical protein
MLRFEVRKERFDVTAFPLPSFLEALPDGLVNVRAGGDIEQPRLIELDPRYVDVIVKRLARPYRPESCS